MSISGAVRAGGAYVEIFAKDGPFQQALDRVQAKMNQTGAAMQRWGMNAAMGAGMIAVPMGLAVKSFATFDDAMRSAGAVSQATGPELEALTARARQLGATTSFTATQVASLMGELGRAGFKPDEIMVMTSAVMDLARATGTDATLSSGIMAASLRQFNLGAGDAARVANTLTAAANMSFNSVESLGEALSYAGPVAAQTGMTIEETAAILGTLGNVGIQGSNAGTALRRLLTITGAEAASLKDIFGVAFLDAAGNVRPLVDTLGEVAAVTANLSSGERLQKFNAAFGLLGITGAQAIAGTVTETRKLHANIVAAGDVAADTAKKMDAGLGGAIRFLTSAVDDVSIAFGNGLAPSLMNVAGFLTKVAGGIGWLLDGFPILSTIVGTATGSVLTFGLGAIGIGYAMKVMSAGIGLVQSVLTGLPMLLNPVVAIIVLVAGAIGLVVYAARQLSPSFRKSTDDMMASIKKFSAEFLGVQAELKKSKEGGAGGADLAAGPTKAELEKVKQDAAAWLARVEGDKSAATGVGSGMSPGPGAPTDFGPGGSLDVASFARNPNSDDPAGLYDRPSGGPSRFDMPRATLGTFGDAVGLGIAPELANLETPVSETAFNTGRMADLMEQSQAAGGNVLPGADSPRAAAAANGAQQVVQQAAGMTEVIATMKAGLADVVKAVEAHAKLTSKGNETLEKIRHGILDFGGAFV
jgi:TP901 family phage tail tape measure protein